MEYDKYEEPSLYFILFFGRYFLNQIIIGDKVYDIWYFLTILGWKRYRFGTF